MKRRLLPSIGLLLLGGLLISGFINRQYLRDQYIVRTTSLQPASQVLEQDIEPTASGSFIYRASQSAVEASTQFNQSCKNVVREQSIVLGCYTRQRIFVYDVKDPRLNGAKQVTAAHELLHAVYQRMPASEKQQVNSLLESTASTITDQRFKDTLAEYRKTEPSEIDNELHSIIGTEIATIPEALEKHYQKYLQNRQKIVNYSKQYEQTFTALDDEIKTYDSKLLDLRSQKTSLEQLLGNQQNDIEAQSTSLSNLRNSGNTSAYNQSVPSYNAKVRAYNADVARLKQVVADYNDIVEKRNNLATTQNDLAKQLDSNYQPLN